MNYISNLKKIIELNGFKLFRKLEIKKATKKT